MNTQPSSMIVDHKRVRAMTATCRCGVTTQVPANVVQNSSPNDQSVFQDAIVARKLEAKGWKVLKRKDGHSCPGCVAKADASAVVIVKDPASIVVRDLKEIKTAMAATPIKHVTGEIEASLMVREMSRTDRRLIFMKLEEVYADEKTGYRDGWSDAGLAQYLNVPRAWVKTVRDENFGPEGSEMTRQALTEAKAVLKLIQDSLNAMQPHIATMSELQRRAEKIERTVIDIEKALRA